MPLSDFTGFEELTAGSKATTGLWNRPLSTISQNLDQLNADSASSLTALDDSLVGWDKGSVTTAIDSDSPLAWGSGQTIASSDSAVLESLTLTAGDGLKGGGDLSANRTINIEPADFAGTGLSDDGSDNLEVDNYASLARLDLGETVSGSWTFSANIKFGDDVQIQLGAAPDYWFEYETANTRLVLTSTDIDGGGSDGDIFRVDDGGQVLNFLATPTVTGTNVVLETRSLTGGDGVASIGDLSANRTVALDLATSAGLKFSTGQLAIEPNDFAGSGLEDDGSDNLRIAAAAAGNGLTGGGGSALAIATDGVQTDEIDLSIAPTWTGSHQFDAELIANGGIDTNDAGPLNLAATNNANQLNLRTDGDVAMSGSLKVGGTGAVAGMLEVTDANALMILNTTNSNATFAAGFDIRESGNRRYFHGYNTSVDRWFLLTRDSDGNGNDADVIRIPDGAADVILPNGGLKVGGTGAPAGGVLEVAGDININPTNTYTLSNVSTDRTLDADSTSTAELADVLSTLIQDLGMDA